MQMTAVVAERSRRTPRNEHGKERIYMLFFLTPYRYFPLLHSCGCASAEAAEPPSELSAKAIYERAIHMNVTAKVSHSMGLVRILFQRGV